MDLAAHLFRVPATFWTLQQRAARARFRAPQVLLYFSEVMWDEVWQRPQELACRLSREIPVVYLSPVQLHRWRDSLRWHWQPWRQVASPGQLLVLSPLIFPGHYRHRGIYAFNCRMLARLLSAWLADAASLVCLTDSPFAWPVVRSLFFPGGQRLARLARLHYDVIDDFPAFAWAPPFARLYDHALLDAADSVTTGTYELWQQHRTRRPDAEFIPCGVDFDAFNRPAGPPPPDLVRLPEPRLGYFGSISDRLDFDLISQLAEHFPSASIVLVGPVRMNARLLPQAPNIHYLGLKPHNELPRYAQHFTVGLIPFLLNEATAKLNPVKTLEYLAAGIPVVSTAIPDVARFFAHTVHIAHDRQEFIRLVAQVIREPDVERIRYGVDLARSSSWNEMAHRLASRLLAPLSAPTPHGSQQRLARP